MTDNFSSSFDDVDSSQTSKCAQDLSIYIDNKFPIEPPSLDTILNDYPYLTKLGHLTMNLLRSLINNGLTEESFEKVDFAIRTLVFEKCSLEVSNLKSQFSLNSIKSMTNSSLSSAASSPYTIKAETAQEIRRLNEELQNSQKREQQLENEIKSQKNVIDQYYEEKEKLFAQLNDKRIQTNGEQANLQIEIIGLKDEIDRQRENVSFAENRIKKLSDQISDLNQDKEDLDKTILELRGKIQNKKEKISKLKLNEKKLKLELQNEKLNSSKLQTELEMQSKLHSDKEPTKESQKLEELVNQYQKVLNERDIDNTLLSQNLTKITKYANRLLEVAEEYEDRLSMAEEDKSVNLSIIKELKEKTNILTEENRQKQDEIFALQKELQDIRDQIAKFEKETGISINSDDIQSILENKSSIIKNVNVKPKQFVELEGIISSLLRYIDILMFGEGDLYPLICRSEPILQNEEIRKSIIASIQDLKVTLSLLNVTPSTSEFLDRIFSDSESIEKLIEELKSKEEYTEFSAISALCSANNNIRRFLEETAESLTDLHSLLPPEYRESDVVLSLKKYITDSYKIYGLIFEAISNQHIFKSDEIRIQPMLVQFVKEVGELLHGLDVEVKPSIGYKVKLTDYPNEIANYIEEQERQIQALKSNGNDNTFVTDNIDSLSIKSRDIHLDTQITQLENEKSTLIQKFDDDSKKYLEKIEELTRLLNEESSKLKLAEQNLELTQKGLAEALKKAKIVEKERDDLLELSNKRKKLFAERKKAIIDNERLNYEEQLQRERKKFENEKSAIVQALEAKESRYKSLKHRYAEMESMYEKQASHQSSKIVDLINNMRVLGEKATQQAEEREKRHKAEVERLEEKVSRILSMANNTAANENNNDESTEMMDTSLIESEKVPSTGTNQQNVPSSIYLTPNKNEIENLNISENIIDNLNNSGTASARLAGTRTSECDRFVAQVGRALSKYTKDDGPWTRSRVLATIQRLCSHLIEVEKGIVNFNNNANKIESTISPIYNTNIPQTPSTLTPSIYKGRSTQLNSVKSTPMRPSLNSTEIESSLIFMNSPTPKKANNIIYNNNNMDSSNISNVSKQPLKIANAINEQREWQSWAMDIALRMNIPPCSPSELRVELKDIFYATNAKSKIVRMITSLREQKKLFKAYPLQVLYPQISEEQASLNKKNLKMKPLILLLRFILIEQKLASKAALNQQHMKQQTKNPQRLSLPLSPRTVQTQL